MLQKTAVADDEAKETLLELSKRDIFGIPVVAATARKAQLCLDRRFTLGIPTCIAFLNAHGCNISSKDPSLAATLCRWLIFNDGIGIDIASRVLHGCKFPENLNGTDFMPRYLRDTRHVFRIFVLGGEAGVAERAVSALWEHAPQHQYVGCHHGYFIGADVPALVAGIRSASADVLVIALGTPLQELWLANHFQSTQCRLGFCVGGLLDFASGQKPRAPLVLRKIRCEWIYRLILEPRRMWRRYLLGNMEFLARLMLATLKTRQS